MSFADLVLMATAAYAAAGVVAAATFATRGVAAVDPAAKGAPVGFRLMILPGTAALWPFVLVRWIRILLRRAQP